MLRYPIQATRSDQPHNHHYDMLPRHESVSQSCPPTAPRHPVDQVCAPNLMCVGKVTGRHRRSSRRHPRPLSCGVFAAQLATGQSRMAGQQIDIQSVRSLLYLILIPQSHIANTHAR